MYGSLRCCRGSNVALADREVEDEDDGVGAELEVDETQEGQGVRWAAQAREQGNIPSGVNDADSMTVRIVSNACQQLQSTPNQTIIEMTVWWTRG